MTDRLKGCWVSFEKDIREDDAKPLLDAIRQLRGVGGVTVETLNPVDWMTRDRIHRALADQMWAILFPGVEQAP